MKLLISIIMIVVFVCGYMSALAEDYWHTARDPRAGGAGLA